MLLVLPGRVPRPRPAGDRPAGGWISDAFPFAHAVRLLHVGAVRRSPWGTVAREAAWLIGLGAAYFALARVSARRLAV